MTSTVRTLDFHPDIRVLVSEIPAHINENIPEIEAAAVRNSTDVRQREFHAGRGIARIALQDFGYEDTEIPRLSNRLPLWPNDIVGSISHSRRLVAVATANDHLFRGLGLDLEADQSVKKELYLTLFTKDEIALINKDGMDATALFCCKEAVFKAVYPIHEEYFDFDAVNIVFRDEISNSFRAQCLQNSLDSTSSIKTGSGKTMRFDDHSIALFQITH